MMESCNYDYVPITLAVLWWIPYLWLLYKEWCR